MNGCAQGLERGTKTSIAAETGPWCLQGRVFVDRDPKHFRLILNFLRDGTAALPSDPIELQEIKQEAEFFQVGDMQQQQQA